MERSDQPQVIQYAPEVVEALKAMRAELTHVGVEELTTVEAVDAAFAEKTGTVMVVFNSVCGCAAGNARPGVALALQNDTIPDRLYTVFAGQDREATMRVRQRITGYPPSSPSVALFKDGKQEFMLERWQIENHDPRAVAVALISAFNVHCARQGPSVPREVFEQSPSVKICGSQIPPVQ